MTILVAVLLAPFTLLTLCFAVELLAGLWPLRLTPAAPADVAAVIIVPAHNEAAILGPRLRELIDAAKGVARVLLVADNCSDTTAEIGRSAGAEVIERFDAVRKGKGFALDFARQHLQSSPPDVAVVIDADCMTDQASLKSLIDRCAASGRPCQATNLQLPGPEASPAVQLSTFAFFIKNVVRQRALQRLAGRAHLLGTGMAFPWSIFAKSQLATGNVVEDLQLGQELATAGHAPIFAEDATVWSNAESQENTLSQRRRWEGGFLENALKAGPRMFGASIRQGSPGALWAAINVMIPPLALLVALDVGAIVLGGLLLWVARASGWPLAPLAFALALSSMCLMLAWVRGGARFVSFGSLVRIPAYILWKLPLYIGLAREGAPKEWTRTKRD